MKASIILSLIFCVVSQISWAKSNRYFICSLGVSYDSYQLGQFDAIFSKDTRSQHQVNQQCYELGAQDGLKDAHENSDCKKDFLAGKEEGLKVSGLSAGVPCYGAGYSMGLAELHFGGREGRVDIVGEDCVSAYNQGVRDAKSNSTPTSERAEPYVTCYEAGYFDATSSKK